MTDRVTNAALEQHLARVEEIVTPRPNWFARAGVAGLVLLLLWYVIDNHSLSEDAKGDRRAANAQIGALTTAVRELETQVRVLCTQRLDQSTDCGPITTIPTPIPTPGATPSPGAQGSPGARGEPGGQGQPSPAPTPSTGRGGGTPPPTTRPTTRPTGRPTRTTSPSPRPRPTPPVLVCVFGICLPPDQLAITRSGFR